MRVLSRPAVRACAHGPRRTNAGQPSAPAPETSRRTRFCVLALRRRARRQIARTRAARPPAWPPARVAHCAPGAKTGRAAPAPAAKRTRFCVRSVRAQPIAPPPTTSTLAFLKSGNMAWLLEKAKRKQDEEKARRCAARRGASQSQSHAVDYGHCAAADHPCRIGSTVGRDLIMGRRGAPRHGPRQHARRAAATMLRCSLVPSGAAGASPRPLQDSLPP